MKYLKIVFAVGILYWLIHSGMWDLQAQKNIFLTSWAPLGFLLVGCNLFFASERWRFILVSKGIALTRLESLKLTLIGIFFNYALPSGVGGDVVKAVLLKFDHPHISKPAVFSSVFFDRIIGLFTMAGMACLSVGIYHEDFRQHAESSPILKTLIFSLFGVFTAFCMGLIAVYHFPKLIKTLTVRFHFLAEFAQPPRGAFISSVTASFIAQVICIVFLVGAGRAAGYTEVPYNIFLIVAPLGFIATALPISPAGVGVGQAAFLFLFDSFLGHKTSLGPLIITTLQLITLAYGLIGAGLFVSRKRKPKIVAQTQS